VSRRHKERIVTEALLPTRWPDHLAVHPALEIVHMTVGPGKRKAADEMCARIQRPRFEHATAQLLHREGEVFCRACPTRGKDARRIAKRRDAKAAIVGKGRKTGGFRGGKRFQFGVLAERLTRFLGLVEAEIGG